MCCNKDVEWTVGQDEGEGEGSVLLIATVMFVANKKFVASVPENCEVVQVFLTDGNIAVTTRYSFRSPSR